MRILVTGGAGFIGSNYVRRIFDGTLKGVTSVTVLDKLTYAGRLENLNSVMQEENFTFVKGDICDSNLVVSLVKDVDAIVNFAAESHVDRSIGNASEFIKTNVVGVQNLLDAVISSGEAKRFLQVSTDEVYGSIQTGSWVEEDPLLPNSPYSASKAGAELLVRAYNRTHNVDTVITRCSNNYGPFHFPEKLIPLFITNMLEGKKVPIYGDGSNMRDWLHVDDHCQGIHAALQNGRTGEIYNIGGGVELSNLEITNKLLRIMGKNESEIEYVEDRKGHDYRYSVDWSKSLNELGYSPKIDFEEGIAQVARWYVENPSWWKMLKTK
jgi:dTDP-glucose 4,6-dehydratase